MNEQAEQFSKSIVAYVSDENYVGLAGVKLEAISKDGSIFLLESSPVVLFLGNFHLIHIRLRWRKIVTLQNGLPVILVPVTRTSSDCSVER